MTSQLIAVSGTLSPAQRFEQLCRTQRGVFSRQQANEHGISDRALAARLRAGRLQRVHRGVYADFTGAVPWEARIWAAWLTHGPDAALAGETALRKHGVDGDWDESVVELDVPHGRRLVPEGGVRVNRCRDFESRLFGTKEPAVVRVEVAVLCVAGRRPRPDRALALVLDACRQGRTTPGRLLTQLEAMPKLRHRALIRGALEDASEGVQSFLELCYLRRVERRHGLPRGTRQVRELIDGRAAYRDVAYEPWDVVVELDGRAGHADAGSAWRDMGRDNGTVLLGKQTLRFGYQIAGDPCSAAAQVAAVLRTRGWPGTPAPCGPSCAVVRGAQQT